MQTLKRVLDLTTEHYVKEGGRTEGAGQFNLLCLWHVFNTNLQRMSQIEVELLYRSRTALLVVLFAPGVLAEIKRTILHCLLPPHPPVRASTFTQCGLKHGLL